MDKQVNPEVTENRSVNRSEKHHNAAEEAIRQI